MPYRPDPIFDDSLEPDVAISVREAVYATLAAGLCLSFAIVVTVCILVRFAVTATCSLGKTMLR